MSSFILPESAYAAVQALVGLDDLQFDELVKALEETPPVLDSESFVDGVISRVTTFASDVARIVLTELLAMLYSGSRSSVSSSELAVDLSEAALEANSEKFPFTAEQRKILESRLSRVFTTRGLRITGKAQYVFFDNDKRYLEARILTDLRPIFDDLPEGIAAATVIHNLRIRYSENGEIKDVYFSMSREDLTELTKVIERALIKEASIDQLAQKSSIPKLQ
jgi:hypothetical protein